MIRRGRFAPSPTGPLHFGSLVAAMASYADARAAGGQWLVRIEDLDPPRARPGAETAILRTLDAYGFRWDEPVWRQSSRSEAYAKALALLDAKSLTYRCVCTRREIAQDPLGREGERVYRGTCRHGVDGARAGRKRSAIRVRVPDEAIDFADRRQGDVRQRLCDDVGDFIVRRADGWFSYQLAAVVDDAAQRITDVVRGADLLASTPRQIFLQRTLHLPTPNYLHVPIAVDLRGIKLSKQTGAESLPAMPLPTLVAAWGFLGQRPPADTPATVGEFWSWAIASWEPAQVPRAMTRRV